MTTVKEIPIRKIKVGEHEQRLDTQDEGIAELAASIRRIGIVVPISVFERQGFFLLVAGHRRYRAAIMSGMESVPAIVRKENAAENTEISFAENYFRKDLSPVELACAIKDCYTRATLTVKEIAAGFHRSEHWVHSMMAVADWPADVLGAIHEKGISVAAASNLVLVTDEQYRFFLLRNAVEQGATARTTAAWLQAWQAMLPPEEAITAEPVSMGTHQTPMVPQAPCLCCGQTFKVNEMSHVPVCGACVKIIRQIGMSG